MKKNNKNNNSVFSKIKEYFNKNGIVSIVILALIIAYFVKSSGISFNTKKQNNYIPYKNFVKMVEKGQIDYVFIDNQKPSSVQFLPTKEYLQDNNIFITNEYTTLKESLEKNHETSVEESMLPATGNLKYVTENPSSDSFKQDLLMNGNLRVFQVKSQGSIIAIGLYALQMFLPIILLMIFFTVMQRRMEPQDSEIQTTIPDTKFKDIAGYEKLKSDSKFILDFLKNPDAYEKIGARLPNGVLFYGPPGTGKTLMAKAIAGEASVPFYKVNGSDFVELYVGLGARRVRKLYKLARQNSPCIVFIDEIDSIGAARGNFRGSSEDDKTLTALLNELDGFAAKEGVITIAATNRLDDLDPALVRPGRFDRQVAVPLPDREEREMILDLYKDSKKMSDEISISNLADRTIGFSPSDLENLLNEAAINAVTENRKKIMQEDIDESFLKIIIKGNKKENKHQTEEEKRVIAYHEAGHAVIGYLEGKPILEVSVVGTTSGAGGYTLSQPKEGLKSKSVMNSEIRELYGGRAAETLIAKNPDEVTYGAMSDLQEATKIIAGYLKYWGLSGNLINLHEFGVDEPSDKLIEKAQNIANELFQETVNMLTKNRDKLDRLATTLLKEKTVDSKRFLEIMENKDKKGNNENEEKIEKLDNEKKLKPNTHLRRLPRTPRKSSFPRIGRRRKFM